MANGANFHISSAAAEFFFSLQIFLRSRRMAQGISQIIQEKKSELSVDARIGLVFK
jgi:hypothetical protein